MGERRTYPSNAIKGSGCAAPMTISNWLQPPADGCAGDSALPMSGYSSAHSAPAGAPLVGWFDEWVTWDSPGEAE